MDELKFLPPILILSETRSFRKAAIRLHVSQPALTKTIQNAEASYGVKLLDRMRVGVTPTPFGEIVAERARLLLQDADALSRDIRTMAQLEGGGLHLGLGPYMAETLKTKTIAAFISRHPRVRLLRNKIILPRDVAAYPFLAPYRPQPYIDWLKKIFAGTELIQPDGGVTFGLECDDYDLLRKTAAGSDCIGALPRSSLEEAFGRRELVELPFKPPAPSTTGGVAYLKNRMLPPAAEVLIQEIVDHFQSFNKVDCPPRGTRRLPAKPEGGRVLRT